MIWVFLQYPHKNRNSLLKAQQTDLTFLLELKHFKLNMMTPSLRATPPRELDDSTCGADSLRFPYSNL